jgi:hypothetical protein
MIDGVEEPTEELLTLRVRPRMLERLTKNKDEEIINSRTGRSTYPKKKSVLRTEATPVHNWFGLGY